MTVSIFAGAPLPIIFQYVCIFQLAIFTLCTHTGGDIFSLSREHFAPPVVNVGKSSFHVPRLWMLRYFVRKVNQIQTYTLTCMHHSLSLNSSHLELMVLIVDVVVVVDIHATDCLHSFWKILDFIAFASFHLFPFHIIICAECALLFLSFSSPFFVYLLALYQCEMTKHSKHQFDLKIMVYCEL